MKILVILIVVTALTACGTVAGFGSDIQKSAEWTKEQMKPKTDLNQNK